MCGRGRLVSPVLAEVAEGFRLGGASRREGSGYPPRSARWTRRMGTGDGDVCVFVRGGAQYSVRVRGGEGGGDHDHADDVVFDC